MNILFYLYTVIFIINLSYFHNQLLMNFISKNNDVQNICNFKNVIFAKLPKILDECHVVL